MDWQNESEKSASAAAKTFIIVSACSSIAAVLLMAKIIKSVEELRRKHANRIKIQDITTDILIQIVKDPTYKFRSVSDVIEYIEPSKYVKYNEKLAYFYPKSIIDSIITWTLKLFALKKNSLEMFMSLVCERAEPGIALKSDPKIEYDSFSHYYTLYCLKKNLQTEMLNSPTAGAIFEKYAISVAEDSSEKEVKLSNIKIINFQDKLVFRTKFFRSHLSEMSSLKEFINKCCAITKFSEDTIKYSTFVNMYVNFCKMSGLRVEKVDLESLFDYGVRYEIFSKRYLVCKPRNGHTHKINLETANLFTNYDYNKNSTRLNSQKKIISHSARYQRFCSIVFKDLITSCAVFVYLERRQEFLATFFIDSFSLFHSLIYINYNYPYKIIEIYQTHSDYQGRIGFVLWMVLIYYCLYLLFRAFYLVYLKIYIQQKILSKVISGFIRINQVVFTTMFIGLLIFVLWLYILTLISSLIVMDLTNNHRIFFFNNLIDIAIFAFCFLYYINRRRRRHKNLVEILMKKYFDKIIKNKEVSIGKLRGILLASEKQQKDYLRLTSKQKSDFHKEQVMNIIRTNSKNDSISGTFISYLFKLPFTSNIVDFVKLLFKDYNYSSQCYELINYYISIYQNKGVTMENCNDFSLKFVQALTSIGFTTLPLRTQNIFSLLAFEYQNFLLDIQLEFFEKGVSHIHTILNLFNVCNYVNKSEESLVFSSIQSRRSISELSNFLEGDLSRLHLNSILDIFNHIAHNENNFDKEILTLSIDISCKQSNLNIEQICEAIIQKIGRIFLPSGFNQEGLQEIQKIFSFKSINQQLTGEEYRGKAQASKKNYMFSHLIRADTIQKIFYDDRSGSPDDKHQATKFGQENLDSIENFFESYKILLAQDLIINDFSKIIKREYIDFFRSLFLIISRPDVYHEESILTNSTYFRSIKSHIGLGVHQIKGIFSIIQGSKSCSTEFLVMGMLKKCGFGDLTHLTRIIDFIFQIDQTNYSELFYFENLPFYSLFQRINEFPQFSFSALYQSYEHATAKEEEIVKRVVSYLRAHSLPMEKWHAYFDAHKEQKPTAGSPLYNFFDAVVVYRDILYRCNKINLKGTLKFMVRNHVLTTFDAKEDFKRLVKVVSKIYKIIKIGDRSDLSIKQKFMKTKKYFRFFQIPSKKAHEFYVCLLSGELVNEKRFANCFAFLKAERQDYYNLSKFAHSFVKNVDAESYLYGISSGKNSIKHRKLWSPQLLSQVANIINYNTLTKVV